MLTGIVSVQLEHPWNSQRAGLHADEQIVADTEAVEIKSADRQPFDLMSFAPGSNHQAAALKKQSGHVEPTDHASRDALWRGGVKFAVAEQEDGDDPRQWNQAEEQSLENFHIAALSRALINH